MEQADLIVILRFALLVGFNIASWKAITALQVCLKHYKVI